MCYVSGKAKSYECRAAYTGGKSKDHNVQTLKKKKKKKVVKADKCAFHRTTQDLSLSLRWLIRTTRLLVQQGTRTDCVK